MPATSVTEVNHYGLPLCIRTDNGGPLCSARAGWTESAQCLVAEARHLARAHRARLSATERPPRTDASHAQGPTTRPPRRSLGAQQRAFSRFQREYNAERPHEALGDRPPASCYTDSPRSYPSRLEEPAYPAHFEVRRVHHNGEIKWRGHLVLVTDVLTGEPIGLEEVSDGAWVVYFATLPLGVLDDATHKLHVFRRRENGDRVSAMCPV